MKVSTARYALPADLTALEPLRDLLGDLPAEFPTKNDHRTRPLAIGIDKHLVAMTGARGRRPGRRCRPRRGVVGQVLRRYCWSGAYMSALSLPGAMPPTARPSNQWPRRTESLVSRVLDGCVLAIPVLTSGEGT